MENENILNKTDSLNATVWIYPKAGGVQLYPKLRQGNMTIANGNLALRQEDDTLILNQNVKNIVKVRRWSSIMTLYFNDTKVQIDFRKPLKWYQRLIQVCVLTIGWKQQLIEEQPFEDFFRSIGVLSK